MMNSKRTLISLALAAAGAMTAPLASAEIEITDKFSVSGFIDMSWVQTDADGSDTQQSSGLDQVELDLKYKFDDKLTAYVDIEYQEGDPDEDDVDLEQAYITYAVNDAVTVKAGRFLSYSGWETEEPTGLFQYSGIGYAPIFYGYYQQGISVMYSGDGYAFAASAINDLDDPEARDSEEMAIELMAAFMPTDSITAKAFYSKDKIDGTNKDKEKINVWASYSEGPLTLAVELNEAENSKAVGTESDGYMLMANYAFEDFALTVRYHDWEVEDSTGATIEERSGITIAPSFELSDNLLIVLEYRMEEDDVTGDDTNTIAVEALLTF
jgi:hypothetical protein